MMKRCVQASSTTYIHIKQVVSMASLLSAGKAKEGGGPKGNNNKGISYSEISRSLDCTWLLLVVMTLTLGKADFVRSETEHRVRR